MNSGSTAWTVTVGLVDPGSRSGPLDSWQSFMAIIAHSAQAFRGRVLIQKYRMPGNRIDAQVGTPQGQGINDGIPLICSEVGPSPPPTTPRSDVRGGIILALPYARMERNTRGIRQGQQIVARPYP